MNEKSLDVLKQYDLRVDRVSRGRGGMILYTDKGIKLFLECERNDKYYEREDLITSMVSGNGFGRVDTYIRSSSNELITSDEEGKRFVVKNWFDGRECNVRDIEDICTAVKTLASLHNVLSHVSEQILKRTGEEVAEYDNNMETEMRDTYVRHMKELKLTRNYLKSKKRKSEFEQTAYKNIGGFYREAAEAVKLLEDPKFDERFCYAKKTGELCHGSYNYHNILFTGGTAAVTNFDRCRNECQVSDLYQFMRKILEKYDWDTTTAYKMIDEYDKVKPISETDLALLASMFAFPEKFWKVMNYYFNSSKAWIPPKTKEKLEKVVEQNDKRIKFVAGIAYTARL